MLDRFGKDDLPADFVPYTAEEVGPCGRRRSRRSTRCGPASWRPRPRSS